jgi:hypothetical protein
MLGLSPIYGLLTTTFFFLLLAMLSRLLVPYCILLHVSGILPQYQKDSLLALYDSTGGPFWISKTNWATASDPCTAPWFGVACDVAKENVTGLSLPYNNMTGSLPNLELPALTSL